MNTQDMPNQDELTRRWLGRPGPSVTENAVTAAVCRQCSLSPICGVFARKLFDIRGSERNPLFRKAPQYGCSVIEYTGTA